MNESFIERAHGRVNLIGEHTDYNGGWVDYLMGGTKLLAEILQSTGQKFSGFNAIIESNMPEGPGLSSSPALEIFGARLTVGGFGDSIVAITKKVTGHSGTVLA